MTSNYESRLGQLSEYTGNDHNSVTISVLSIKSQSYNTLTLPPSLPLPLRSLPQLTSYIPSPQSPNDISQYSLLPDTPGYSLTISSLSLSQSPIFTHSPPPSILIFPFIPSPPLYLYPFHSPDEYIT